MTADARPEQPLVLIKGDATDEEVAALVAVLQAVGAASTAPTPRRRPASPWASPARQVRSAHQAGLGGWRASALPR